MSWWDRFVAWWRAIADTKVVGSGAPSSPNVLSEVDRAWLREAAASLDRAVRMRESGVSGEAAVTIVLTDELARVISARLRGIAG